MGEKIIYMVTKKFLVRQGIWKWYHCLGVDTESIKLFDLHDVNRYLPHAYYVNTNVLVGVQTWVKGKSVLKELAV